MSKAEQVAAAAVKCLGGDAATIIDAALKKAEVTYSEVLAADALIGTYHDRTGWNRVNPGDALSFPQDHGAHERTAQEWYYVVANVFATPPPPPLPAGSEGDAAAPRAQTQTPIQMSVCVMIYFSTLAPQDDATIAANKADGGLRGRIATVYVMISTKNGKAYSSTQTYDLDAVESFCAASPLAVQIGVAGMEASLQEVGDGVATNPPTTLLPQQLNVSASTSDAMLTLSLIPTAGTFVMQHGASFNGNIGAGEGNGNLYYSLPMLQVMEGGSILLDGVPYTINSGLAWVDHQWGTLGLPSSWWSSVMWKTAATVGTSIPIVDRGFSIAGQENWFGLMFYDGELKGSSVMGTRLNVKAQDTPDGDITLEWLMLGGTRATTTGSLQAVKETRSELGYFKDFVLSFDSPITKKRMVIMAQSFSDEAVLTWAKGDTAWEGSLILKDVHGRVLGSGWSEQVGWDASSTAAIVATLNGGASGSSSSSSPSLFEQTPAAARRVGTTSLIIIFVMLALLIVAMVFGIRKVMQATKRKRYAPLTGGGDANGNGGNSGNTSASSAPLTKPQEILKQWLAKGEGM